MPVVNTLDGCFQGAIANDTLYLQTNWKAPKWRMVAVPLRTPSQEHWKEIIPEGESRMEDFRLAGGKIVAQYSHNAASELKIFQADGTAAGGIALPQLGTVAGITGRWKSSEVFFSFQSFAIPATVYRYDLARARRWTCGRNRRCRLIASAFEVKQVWYESKDKTRVPMFLFYKKGLQLDGANPVLMTAYGGFDVSETPLFRDDAVLWVEHGGVFALPSLRGGGEFGEDWHRAGMLEKKQNVFDDFYAAAEWLIANHYTRADKLAITGRSNGGLLMGAAMTQRPELFGAIVCGYPLLDMVRYQNFLVAKYWVPEYGSSEDAEQFPALFAYSPYHHVVAGTKYPAILFLTGDSDTRVAPLHARKMTAAVQAAQGGDKPILLLYDTKLGHSEGRPVSKIIEEDTQVLGFLMWQVGVEGILRLLSVEFLYFDHSIRHFGGMDARDYAGCGEGVGWADRVVAGAGVRLRECGDGADCGGADTVAGGCVAGAAENFACAYGDSGVGRAGDFVLPGMDSGGAHAGWADYSGGGDEVQRRRESDRLAARFGGDVFDSCGRAGGSERRSRRILIFCCRDRQRDFRRGLRRRLRWMC